MVLLLQILFSHSTKILGSIGAELEGRIITVEFMKEGEKLTSSGAREGGESTPRVPIVKKQIVKEQRYSSGYINTINLFRCIS